MDTLLLTAPDVRHLAREVGLDALMDALIDRLDEALRAYDADTVETPQRSGFAYAKPYPGLVEWMPCLVRDAHATVKMVGYHPENPGRVGLPTILSTVSAYDTQTGHLRALVDGTLLTALRTGAASAIATRLLAAPGASTLGLLGAGAQAVTQLHAIGRVLDLERVVVYDVDPRAEASFAERVAPFAGALSVEAAPLLDVVAEADVLCTATSIPIGAGPLFPAEAPLREGVHINAVGSDFSGKFELPAALLRRSFVCPDLPGQALREGECQQLRPDEIGPSLHEVAQNADAYAAERARATVFDSTGWALEDYVAMDLFMEYAQALGVGTRVPIEVVPDDALDPYEALHTMALAR